MTIPAFELSRVCPGLPGNFAKHRPRGPHNRDPGSTVFNYFGPLTSRPRAGIHVRPSRKNPATPRQFPIEVALRILRRFEFSIVNPQILTIARAKIREAEMGESPMVTTKSCVGRRIIAELAHDHDSELNRPTARFLCEQQT